MEKYGPYRKKWGYSETDRMRYEIYRLFNIDGTKEEHPTFFGYGEDGYRILAPLKPNMDEIDELNGIMKLQGELIRWVCEGNDSAFKYMDNAIYIDKGKGELKGVPLVNVASKREH